MKKASYSLMAVLGFAIGGVIAGIVIALEVLPKFKKKTV